MKKKSEKPSIIERVGIFNIAVHKGNFLVLQPKKPAEGTARGFKCKQAAVDYAQATVTITDAKARILQLQKLKGTWTDNRVNRYIQKEKSRIADMEPIMLNAISQLR